jgi:hypothetical protein
MTTRATIDWPGRGIVSLEPVNMTPPLGHVGAQVEATVIASTLRVLVAYVEWHSVEPLEGAGRIGSFSSITEGFVVDSYEIIGARWGRGLRWSLAGLIYSLPVGIFRQLPDRALRFAEVHGGEGPRAPQIHVRAPAQLLFSAFDSMDRSSGVLLLLEAGREEAP